LFKNGKNYSNVKKIIRYSRLFLWYWHFMLSFQPKW